VDTPNRLRPPLTPGHWLGTDEFGRGLLARLVWGARVSLVAGAATAAAAMLIGVVLGVFGGYYSGWTETVVMRLTDILMAFPYILLAIAIVAGLGPGLRNAMIAITIVGFPIYTRLVRGIVLSVREREFVEAARALGSPDRFILVRHIVPQLLSPVIVAFSLDVGAKILATAGLSFLGLGTQPPTADWGSMLATGRQFVILSPHVVLLPGLAIFVIVLALNLVGDALRDLQRAEDVVQESFVAAWFGLLTLVDPAAFPGWFRGIVRHQAHRLLRQRRLEALPLVAAEAVPAEESGPHDRLEQGQQVAAV